MNVFRQIGEDISVNPHAKSKFVLVFFRLANASLRAPMPIRVACSPLRVIYRVVVDWLLGIDIPSKTQIGRRVIIYHGHALVVNEGAIIGDDCILRHCVTIGNKLTANGESAAPRVGDGVEFGAGAVVIGPLEIGSGAKIGALSVVTRSVPANTTVVGNPARPITFADKTPLDSLQAGNQ